jgi:hypothetical protein
MFANPPAEVCMLPNPNVLGSPDHDQWRGRVFWNAPEPAALGQGEPQLSLARATNDPQASECRVRNREDKRSTRFYVHHLTVEVWAGSPEQAWLAELEFRDSISSADLLGGEID